ASQWEELYSGPTSFNIQSLNNSAFKYTFSNSSVAAFGVASSTPKFAFSASVSASGGANDGLTIERSSGGNAFGFRFKSDVSTNAGRGAITYKGSGGVENELMSFG